MTTHKNLPEDLDSQKWTKKMVNNIHQVIKTQYKQLEDEEVKCVEKLLNELDKNKFTSLDGETYHEVYYNYRMFQQRHNYLEAELSGIILTETPNINEYIEDRKKEMQNLHIIYEEKTAQLSELRSKYSIPQIDDIAQSCKFYNIDESRIESLRIADTYMNSLCNMSKILKTKWKLLIEDLASSNDEIEFLKNKFNTFTEMITKSINENRESPSYFDDLFDWIENRGILISYEKYSSFQTELYTIISNKSGIYKKEITEVLDSFKDILPLEIQPHKSKLSSEQLKNNSDILDLELQKFILLDMNELAHEEMSDLIGILQVKIKKYLVINKELTNREINSKIIHADKLKSLLYVIDKYKGDNCVGAIYDRIIDLLVHSEIIIHKWVLAGLLIKQDNGIQDKMIENVSNELDNIQNKHNVIVQDIDNHYKWLELQHTIKLEHILGKMYNNECINKAFDIIDHAFKNMSLESEDNSNIVKMLNTILGNQEIIKTQLKSNGALIHKPVDRRKVLEVSSVGTIEYGSEESCSDHKSLDNKLSPDNKSVLASASDSAPDSTSASDSDSDSDSASDSASDNKSINAIINTPTQLITSKPINQKTNNQDDPNANAMAIGEFLASLDGLNKVNDIKEANDQYNNPETIILTLSNNTYYCCICSKTLKYSGSKPHIHCKTTMHCKKFIQWTTAKNLI